jgi:hypothetical protein
MAPKVKCLTSLGNTRNHTKQVFAELAEEFEIFFAWGNGATGDHAAGKALDMMSYGLGTVARPGAIRPGWNMQVAEYGLKHHARLGIKYIIADGKIWSSSPKSVTGVDPWKPKAYNGSDPHRNHNHWSFLENPPAYKAPGPSPYVAFPGSGHFKLGNKSDTIGRMNTRLNHKDLGAPDSREFDAQSKAAYSKWQKLLGYSGADADGIPGETSWDRLRVKKDTVIASPPAPKPVPDVPAPAPAPVPAPAPADPAAELEVPVLKPAQLVREKGEPAVYAVGLRVVHIVSPEHLSQLREQGWVSGDIKEVSKAHLAELLRKPLH